MEIAMFAVGVVVTLLGLLALSLRALFYVCAPNQVIIFSGQNRRVGARNVGYRVLKGGNTLRRPFIERVDVLDLSNMIIELNATGAYSKGGVPLNVQGVANVKIAGHEPVLNNAIERFLGKSRADIMGIAKATLEGSLRGVLATLTPEQINEDRNLFAEKLVQEVEQDMTALGLVVDTLKIQNITDDVKYLDSIGRIRNAELLSSARIAESQARADAVVRAAENQLQEVQSQMTAQTSVANADAQKRLTDALTRRDSVIAEERAAVAALLAQAEADIAVQKARLEQVRRKLEADVIQPAMAECEAMEQQAAADVAAIIEDGKAKAEALTRMSQSWQEAGDQAREIFLLQKIEGVIRQVTSTISETNVGKMTLIDAKTSGANGSDPVSPARLMALNEQLKQMFGIDLAEKVKGLGSTKATPPTTPEPVAALREEAPAIETVTAPPLLEPRGRRPKAQEQD
ncbi:MAG: flotillin family protein [Armatimonadetes bacterium]|nr:flotillin family protein [Armatimonadota bacterium]